MPNNLIKRKSFLIGIFIMVIILIPVLSNIINIRSRIYSIIDYNVNLPNREEIINKVENFNYEEYLNSYSINYYLDDGITSYVDIDLIRFLKNRIENDIGLKIWPFYKHNLVYSFLAENHSKLHLSYNNLSIVSIKDQNNQSLFLREDNRWWEFSWYLNFAQIPYVHGDKSTLVLSDFIFVKINVEYKWLCGYVCEHRYSFEQYLVLSENLDVVLIFIYDKIFID